MRTLILIVTVFLTFAVSAKDMVVEDGRRKFEISLTQDKVVYKDELTSLSLIKRACNSHLIARLQKRFDKFFTRPFLEDSRPEFFKIKIDGKQFFEPRFGTRAVFLLSLPDEMKKIKIEENLNCAKN